MGGAFGTYGSPWRGMDETGSASRWIAAMLATAFVLVAMGMPSFATLTPGKFNAGDGNLDPDITIDEDDWGNHTSTATVPALVASDPVGPTDDSFGQGSDEDDPVPTETAGSIPPNKDDFTRFQALQLSENGNDFLYLAWVRTSDNGSANMDFELNQSSTPSANGVTPVRTAGDKLITYSFGGSAGSVTLGISEWITTGVKADCESQSSVPPCWENIRSISNPGISEGEVNATGPVSDPFSADPTAMLPINTFGEAGINLTALQRDLGICISANSVYLKSRASGSSFAAELKDFVAPITFPVNSCGGIEAIKYHDLNADGGDDSEPRLGGWTMFIDNGNGTLDIGEVSVTTTEGSGSATFPNVLPGTYTVCEVQQNGWFTSDPGTGNCKTQTVSASSGTQFKFGNYQNASISGNKFNDTDGPGSGETGPAITDPRFTIGLYEDKDGDGVLDSSAVPAEDETTALATTQTSADDGTYSFTDLMPGNYIVCEVPETGWTESYPSNSKCAAVTANEDGGHAVSLSSGEASTGNDFGNYQGASISGKKFDDTDGPGSGETGPAITDPRFTIGLYEDKDGDGVLDSSTDPTLDETTALATTQTSTDDGTYSFTGLEPGKYIVCEVPQAGWIESYPSNSKCAAVTANEDGGHDVSLSSGGSSTGNDFGNYQLGSISGTKWNDLDHDGLVETGEPALLNPQHTINLYRDADGNGVLDSGETTPLDTQLTDAADGTYSFTGLAPGSYIVCEEGAAGWSQTAPSNATCAPVTTSNATDDGGHAVVVTSGEDVEDVDFANFEIPIGSISGHKYHDLDGDGQIDSGEPAIEGWPVTLYVDLNGNEAIDGADSLSAVPGATGTSGMYVFEDLAPGNYIVCEAAQKPSGTGWSQSAPTTGPDCATTTGHSVNLPTATSTSEDNDFLNYKKTSISGTKFNDDDGFGSGTAGAALGSPTFTIHLYNDADRDGVLAGAEADSPVATTTTATDGTYSFTGLTPGSYFVCEAPEDGWTQSAPASDPNNITCQATSDEDGGHHVTLVSDTPQSGKDFSNFQKGSISGTKWEDLLADGLDATDIASTTPFTIRLYLDSNNDGALGDTQPTGWPQSTTTDPVTGAYSFTNLDPGSYIACEEDAGWTQSAPISSAANTTSCASLGVTIGDVGYARTLTSGGSSTGNDFANYQLGSISGTKWNDLDHDGVVESGEPALQNPAHTINLYGDTNGDGVLDAGETTPLDTDVTDANGTYSFTGLTPGSYIVCEEGAPGWSQTAPSNATCAPVTTSNATDDGGHAVVVTSGEDVEDVDFANFEIPNGSISGHKYHDLDGDGQIGSGEPVIEGWPVTLYRDINGNGSIDGLDSLSAVLGATGPSGVYVFEDLAPGKYIICESAQKSTTDTGWSESAPTTGPSCSVGDAAKGHSVNLPAATSSSEDNDFLNYKKTSISGTKFNDDDGFGSGTAGAALGSPTFTIHLYNDADRDGVLAGAEADSPVATTTTATDGTYSFTNLVPGSYFVCEAPEDGWTQSAPASDPNNITCQATTDEDGGHHVTLVSDTPQSGKDFSNFQKGSISGTKWEDLLADGLDVTDVAASSEFTIRLYLDSNGDGALGDAQPTGWPQSTTTDPVTGAYSFTNLDPGSYIVCEVSENGWTQTHPSNSTCAPVTTNEDAGHAVSLSSGESSTDNDFANYQLGSISGTKWNDLDNNGIDAGDPALQSPQHTINLYKDLNDNGVLDAGETAVFQTDVTDANGTYSFTELVPGSYLVCEEGEAGWTETDPSNTNCAAVTTSNASDNGGHAVVVSSGEDVENVDFANFEIPAGSISGSKYHDLDGDGQLDPGEPPIEGWSISLYEDDGDGELELVEIATLQSDSTDASGMYLFTDLEAGDYLVCENAELSTTDTGWIQSAPANGADCDLVPTNADEGHAVTLQNARDTSAGNDFMNYKKATIHVAKTTSPANANETFAFDGPAQDTGAINPSSTPNDSFSRSVEPGSYTWTEETLEAWRLDSITCTDSAQTGGKASLEDEANRNATFNVESGDEVTCTFHNVQLSASARVVKTTDPSTESKAGFNVKLTGPGTPTGGETVATDAQGNASFTTELQEGSYTIEEVNLPSSWKTPIYTDCTFVVDFPADDGRQFTCQITNTKEEPPPPPPPAQGMLIVQKETIPDGATQTFSFSGALTATLGDGQSSSRIVDPGTYTVSEAVAQGWNLTDITCTDSNATGQASTGDLAGRTATFRVEANETVTCVFTNTVPPAVGGTIAVTKQTVPDGATETFEFEGALSGSLSDGESMSKFVEPGAYIVSENETESWELTEIICTDSVPSGTPSTVDLAEGSATFNVDDGETVECVFTNVENEVLPKPPVASPEPELLPRKVKTGILPFTGSDPYTLLGLAGLLIIIGGSLVLINRRRFR